MKPAAWLLAACCLFAAPAVVAQDHDADPAASPEVQGNVRDPEFGVRSGQFGLERRVEMFQWRADGDAYVRDWSDAWLDSAGFPPGHENPGFPLQSRRWVAAGVTIDGMPLDPAVLEQVGSWREFRPGFSALPGNLAATFQPQGDGLGSALNPLAPEVGDLRIHWRELVLPPLGDRIELRHGRWQLRQGGGPRMPGKAWMVAAGLGLGVLVLLVLARSRRRR